MHVRHGVKRGHASREESEEGSDTDSFEEPALPPTPKKSKRPQADDAFASQAEVIDVRSQPFVRLFFEHKKKTPQKERLDRLPVEEIYGTRRRPKVLGEGMVLVS